MWPAQGTYDGAGFAEQQVLDGGFTSSHRNLQLAITTDPFQLARDDGKKSETPFLVSIMNTSTPHHFRLGAGAFMVAIVSPVVGTAKAAKAAKRDPYTPVLELMVDELLYLYHHGIPVFDASVGEMVEVRAKLMHFMSDLQGLRAVFEPGAGCIRCNIKPTCKAGGVGKTIWNGHYPLLPVGHALRPVLCGLHNPEKEQRTGEEGTHLRYRSEPEMAYGVKHKDLPDRPGGGAAYLPFPTAGDKGVWGQVGTANL